MIDERLARILDRLDLPPDVREWCDARPEVTVLLLRAHVRKWPARKILRKLRKTAWYKESEGVTL